MKSAFWHVVVGSSLALLAAARPASTGELRPPAAANFPRGLVGVWKLLSIEDRHDGKAGFYDRDLGSHLTGVLIVDERGIACVQGMKVDRPRLNPGDGGSSPSDAELLASVRGYFGYCVENLAVRRDSLVGRFLVSSDANEVGTEWERPFSLSGDRLLLTPEWVEQGVHIQRTATLERVR